MMLTLVRASSDPLAPPVIINQPGKCLTSIHPAISEEHEADDRMICGFEIIIGFLSLVNPGLLEPLSL